MATVHRSIKSGPDDSWWKLDEPDMKELKVEYRRMEIPRGDYVYFEAYHLNKIYFLQEGIVKIGFIDEDGNERIKEILQKGEIFGQFTLERVDLRGEFAQAYKDRVVVLALAADDFEKILQKRPDLMYQYSRQVGNRLRNTQTRLLNLLNKDVKTRLIHFLWQLVEQKLVERRPEGFCMPNYLTHEDIANLIGSSRQTVTTMINELENEGILAFNRQQICFLDIRNLEKRLATR